MFDAVAHEVDDCRHQEERTVLRLREFKAIWGIGFGGDTGLRPEQTAMVGDRISHHGASMQPCCEDFRVLHSEASADFFPVFQFRQRGVDGRPRAE